MSSRRCCNCFYGWPVVVASGVAIITSFPGNTFGIAFFLPHLQRELGLTKSEMGLVWGAAILVTAAFLPLAVKLVDRQGPWRVLFVCTFGLGLFGACSSGEPHPPQYRPTPLPTHPIASPPCCRATFSPASLHSLLLVAHVPLYAITFLIHLHLLVPSLPSHLTVTVVAAGDAPSAAQFQITLDPALPRDEVQQPALDHIAVGLGAATGASTHSAVEAGLARARLMAGKAPLTSVNIALPAGSSSPAFVREAAQVALLSGYDFDKYKGKKGEAGGEDGGEASYRIVLAAGEEVDEAHVEAARTQSEISPCTIFARDLGNERGDVANPAFVEEVALSIAKEHGMPFRVRAV